MGAYSQSLSPYGTFDQGGNVWEWTEAVGSSPFRGLRGGGFSDGPFFVVASIGFIAGPDSEDRKLGFRVASIAELPMADFDTDGDDFLIWQAGFSVDDRGDANGDGVTDGDDFLIWQSQFARPAVRVPSCQSRHPSCCY